MILACFTKTIPKQGEKVNVYLTVGELSTPTQIKRELLKEQIMLRKIYKSLGDNSPPFDPAPFLDVTDVLFLQLKENRTPDRVKYELTEYKNEDQKRAFMERINAKA